MFVWTDLSTFDVGKAKQFYSDCLGWRFDETQPDYIVGHARRTPVVGLYSMPDTFRRIGMPSFWMSYIQVDDLERVVEAARRAKGRIELGPEPGLGGGSIALIRDPSGAGFTCYEGQQRRGGTSGAGHPVWHELHVSDLDLVAPFYSNVFGWNVTPSAEATRYLFVDPAGTAVGGARVTPNLEKGDKEYWGVYFEASNLRQLRARIDRAGGRSVQAESVDSRATILAFDPQGAAFYLIESQDARDHEARHRPKWRALVGMVTVASAITLDADWLWGVLFLLWVIPDLRSGSTHFLEHVTRDENPLMYWGIVGTWVALSLYLFVFGWT